MGASNTALPTIFHITHWKAGSQWLHKILLALTPERIVSPQTNERQYLTAPVIAGAVYPTLYVTKEQFFSVSPDAHHRKFVIIRDLRDTLVSGYFSIRYSHAVNDERLAKWREQLNSMPIESGLLLLMDEWLPASAKIQSSWIKSGEPIFRYEDLLNRDIEILERILIAHCEIPVSAAQLRNIVESNRFELVTGGRTPGDEDVTSHERKGVAGDWKNYFSKNVIQKFLDRYSMLLKDCGYSISQDIG